MVFHGGKRMFIKHKVCRFCADPSLKIDYKEPKRKDYTPKNFWQLCQASKNSGCGYKKGQKHSPFTVYYRKN
jgi:hypothetical protein